MRRAVIFFSFLAMMSCATAQDIALPSVDFSVESSSVMEALRTRHSVRNFSDRALTLQELSNVCWAACGAQRDAEHITAPSAMNRQEVLLYVFTQEGTYEYLPKDNVLKLIALGDNRKLVGDRQESVNSAPALLVLVVDFDKFGHKDAHSSVMTGVDVGNVSENINLYCQSVGLATVPRGSMNAQGISELLGLTENQVPVINNPVGYPAE